MIALTQPLYVAMARSSWAYHLRDSLRHCEYLMGFQEKPGLSVLQRLGIRTVQSSRQGLVIVFSIAEQELNLNAEQSALVL
jgi:hypothetical protein